MNLQWEQKFAIAFSSAAENKRTRLLEPNLPLEYITSHHKAFLVAESFPYYFLIKPPLKITPAFKSQGRHANGSPGNPKLSGYTEFLSSPAMETTKRARHKECLLRISFNDHLQLVIP